MELQARASNERGFRLYQASGFVLESRLERRIRSTHGNLEADVMMAWFNPGFISPPKQCAFPRWATGLHTYLISRVPPPTKCSLFVKGLGEVRPEIRELLERIAYKRNTPHARLRQSHGSAFQFHSSQPHRECDAVKRGMVPLFIVTR